MLAKLLTGICLLFLLFAAISGAADIGSLEARVEAAKSEAGSLASELRAAQDELAAAQREAAAASAREDRLSGLLAEGEERAAELGGQVERAQHQLKVERARLRRAEGALSERLVAIYESGSPDSASVILGSSSIDELTTRVDYIEEIEQSDTLLAERVEQVRDQMHAELKRVAALRDRVDDYNARLAAARSQISEVRAEAEAAAAQERSVAAARSASLATLKSKIGGWVSDIQKAEEASRAAAEEEVGRWLGGPYAIPAFIVMCESGGDYGAVNPSSGAGGAYQILPSTWELYGGQGAPEEASKAEQDSIAAQIWADSGPSAWVCAG